MISLKFLENKVLSHSTWSPGFQTHRILHLGFKAKKNNTKIVYKKNKFSSLLRYHEPWFFKTRSPWVLKLIEINTLLDFKCFLLKAHHLKDPVLFTILFYPQLMKQLNVKTTFYIIRCFKSANSIRSPLKQQPELCFKL